MAMTGYGGERRNCIQRCLYDKENDSSEKQGFKVSVNVKYKQGSLDRQPFGSVMILLLHVALMEHPNGNVQRLQPMQSIRMEDVNVFRI